MRVDETEWILFGSSCHTVKWRLGICILSGYQPKTLSVFARISSSSGGWRRQRTLCVPPLAVGSLAIHRSQLFEEEHYTSRAREVRAASAFSGCQRESQTLSQTRSQKECPPDDEANPEVGGIRDVLRQQKSSCDRG